MNTKITTRNLRTFVLALTLGLVTAFPAMASDGGVKVSYRDLDLQTIEGAHTLYGRLQAAARKVCGFQGTSIIEQSIWKSCYRGAVTDAVAKVNSPLLTAVHTGQPPVTAVAMLAK